MAKPNSFCAGCCFSIHTMATEATTPKPVKKQLTKIMQADTSKLRIPNDNGATNAEANVIDEQLFTTNITLQSLCPTNTIDHIKAPTDPVVIKLALNALSTAGPANPAFRPACS